MKNMKADLWGEHMINAWANIKQCCSPDVRGTVSATISSPVFEQIIIPLRVAANNAKY